MRRGPQLCASHLLFPQPARRLLSQGDRRGGHGGRRAAGDPPDPPGHQGNKSEAARLLRTDYKTLHLKMKQYGIDSGQFKEFSA